jgi:DNA-binding response OmpR family regulator
MSDKSTKKFILVAEDDPFYGNIFKTKLTWEGYDVILAVNGEETIRQVKMRKPDLLLLDLIMPVKDGFAALGEIKCDPDLKSIKVVVISNLSQEEDIVKAKTLGADDYFVKTNISIQEMLEKVKQQVG